ncbi:glutathione S-transferase family protein [Ramlibacter albus]|uniref:Glutathione S-transferase family protein n=1 Tax=Ramlibacter albus TaxID=2079448 RepID=A0A923S4R6_9BURK|nr:glutathione S-transferase family protein [Ramlibacter albus]MBC5767884.1 glutathione S-transferase family protein [Ramlibacter albus]
MKLFTTPASPWVRRCVVSISELGLDNRVERIPTKWPHTWATQTTEYAPEFAAATPVARIPALVTDDGIRLVESHAICDYLNAELGGYRLLPQSGRKRWELMSVISITSGALEAQISRRAELLRQPPVRSEDFIRKMHDREHRCYDALEQMTDAFTADVDLAQITLACALSYHDFRFKEDWRSGKPKLTQWFERFIQRPSMQATMPTETPQH